MTKIRLGKNAFKKILLVRTLILSSSLLLSACLTTQTGSSGDYRNSNGQDADYYLAEADKQQGSAAAPWKLKAAAAYVQSRQFEQAHQLLNSFQPTQLPLAQRDSYYLLKGESALAVGQNFTAIRALQSVNASEQKSLSWRRHYQTLLADALSGNQRLADAALVRIAAEPLFESSTQLNQQMDKAWDELNQASLGELELKRSRASSDLAIGWLDMAILTKQYSNRPSQLAQSFNRWQQRYGNHPAANYLNSDIPSSANIEQFTANKVALIAPLNGRLGAIGRSLRDGFLAGYFSSQQDRGELADIIVYDSSNGDSIDSLYRQAMADGADMVVGPLLKRNVEQLAQIDRMPLPTLVLNQVDSNVFPANFYQFGLPVEDEARQIAQHAINNGQKRAFIINAESSTGRRASASFIEAFEALGGTIVQAADISKDQDPKQAIRRLLGADKIDQRTDELQELLDVNIESSGIGSANADFVFLIAKAKEARMIKPYLNYYYAYNLPVYATSSIYNGRNNAKTDKDLSGIMFTDSPWMLGSNNSISRSKRALAKTLPNSNRNLGRFFALGHDAFMLIPALSELAASPDNKLQGISGELSMDYYGRIVRHLSWGQFDEGKVKPVSP